MKKKTLMGAVLASAIALSASFAGCSLVSSNANKDMEQVVATVNISTAEGLTERDNLLIEKYKSAVGSTDIIKRDLIAYFLNAGYSQVQSGASYETVFNSLLDGLVDNAVLTQYAIMYVLDYKSGGNDETVLGEYNSKTTYAEKLEYLLNDPAAYPDDSDKDIKIAQYNLYSSLNNAIDSYEESLIEEDEKAAGTSESRSTPSGVDVQQDDYYPAGDNKKLDYNVYTGYAGYGLGDSGVFKDDLHEGSTKSTRIKAYNNFMASLIQNGMVDPDKEDLRDVKNINYVRDEYVTQLENRLLEKYYDLYEEEQNSRFSGGGEYGYINSIYNDLLRKDEQNYADAASFKTAMDNMSDTSFVLYSPGTDGNGTFGYVYNILLPFSAKQKLQLTAYQNDPVYKNSDGEGYNLNYYLKRNELLKNIKTTDQRSAWFNGSVDYSFKAAEGEYFDSVATAENPYSGVSRGYLFFENNLTDSAHYKPLEKYAGKYAYKGYVYEREDGSYLLKPDELGIDQMLAEFKAYVNYVLGEPKADYEIKENYYENLTEANFYDPAKPDKKEINYENFVYASGKVDLGVSGVQYRGNIFNKESACYKALSAVNELQYAYTTDTGVLSEYLGYSVSTGNDTGYIKEFEYAAHKAIEGGAGSFTVCAGDYGWHLIYATYTFGTPDPDNVGSSAGGAEYAPDWAANVDKEGTFENLFYEWVKSNDISEISTTRRTQLINQFNSESTVKKFQNRYQDLLDLGN